MIRRLMLKEAAASGEPLYSFEDITYSYSSRKLWTTNGNHIKINTTANSRVICANWDSARQNWASASVPLFTVAEGDAAELKMKNITYSGNTVQSNITIGLRRIDSDAGVNIGSGTIYLPTGQTTLSDVINPSTCNYTGGVTWFYFSVYRAVTIEFDLELYINGVRYV